MLNPNFVVNVAQKLAKLIPKYSSQFPCTNYQQNESSPSQKLLTKNLETNAEKRCENLCVRSVGNVERN